MLKVSRRTTWAAALVLAGVWIGSSAAAEEKKSWADTVTLKGDLRYRLEMIDEDGKDERYRERIRARLNAEAKLNDEASVGIGFSSGGADPVSGNQSLGDGLAKKEIRLDLAYFKYAVVPEQLVLTGGRINNPFIRTQDLIWDGDLKMDGLGLNAATSPGEDVELLANAGYIWLQEHSSDDDSMLYGGQAGVRFGLGETAQLLVGGSVYHCANLDGMGAMDWEGNNDFYGNSSRSIPVDATTTTEVYAMDFLEVEGFVDLQFEVAEQPMSIHGSYVVNTEADSDDTGFLVGVSCGKAKKAGDLMVGYNYRDLEKDAVVGAFTDSDFGGGGTDVRGHRLYASYALNSHWSLGGSCFVNEKKVSSDALDYQRYQLDLNVKF
ncbi:MAG: putative porin [Kiritimatiellae bacterium]|nr:putative porin [Kiritimatiellia bacterium]